MSALDPILIAIVGGVLPSLAWLWFWLREDSTHPEPRRLIALAFLAGMATVAVAVPIEQYVAQFIHSETLIFTAWSSIEEVLKYVAALLTVLWQREDDEPIDAVIYMVTVALGFAALENTLFLLSPLAGSTPLEAIVTGNLRFVGATLLHVLSSAVIGVSLALSFYESHGQKIFHAFIGVILAAILHASFNFFILNTPEGELLRTFFFVWIGVIALLAMLEFVKRIAPQKRVV